MSIDCAEDCAAEEPTQPWTWYVCLAQLPGFPERLRLRVLDLLTEDLRRLAVSSRANTSRWAIAELPDSDEESETLDELPPEAAAAPAAAGAA